MIYLNRVTPTFIISALVSVLLYLPAVWAGTPPAVPEALAPWKAWVLHGEEDRINCIPRYNNADMVRCAWPRHLEMSLEDSGGRFRQAWLVNLETWVPLPGNSRHWPGNVRVNGAPATVLEQKGGPAVLLPPGQQVVTGAFTWSALPEHLAVPPESGLLSLTVNRTAVDFPDLDSQGRLWLKHGKRKEKIENRLKIDCFRLIDDDIPARVKIHLTLDVAGTARQVFLGPLYAPGRFTPVSLQSALPAKLEKNGAMAVQVRPGRFTVRLDLRHSGPLEHLAHTPPPSPFWPERETWSFKARPGLRLTEISGAPPVDPRQTRMPGDWHPYPAYLMEPDTALTFKEIKRGDPLPAPDQLSLERDLWLRFDGSGYTIRDRIQGKKNTRWRLEMSPAVILGTVIIDGREQLITRRKGSEKAGIELRNGQVNFRADSTVEGLPADLPATGWDHDFQAVQGRLHLPPGWKLVHAAGADTVSRTWVTQWTLLDFFIVLIFTIALAKLRSKKLAPVAFVTLVLTWHDPGAPKFIWPALLAGLALLAYLPRGRFREGVKICQGAAVLAFLAIVIPYGVHALRIGIYPQLEHSRALAPAGGYDMATGVPETLDAVREAVPVMRKAAKAPARSKPLAASYASPPAPDREVMQYDPKALNQTGPGLPDWQPFNTIGFGWSGPVTRDQVIRFTLIGPRTNLVLAFARVGLIILLALGMFGVRYHRGAGPRIQWPGVRAVSLLVLMSMALAGPVRAAEIPSQALLDQLRDRLLETDSCFPACADIGKAAITMEPDRLAMKLRVDSRVDAAVPLPGHAGQWLPNRVLLDGKPAGGLFREAGHLWIMVPRGRHTVTLSGPVRRQNALQIRFILLPRQLAVTAQGWSVNGVHPDGSFDPTLRFKRMEDPAHPGNAPVETGTLPGFARVERTLRLGLVWKVQTRITRLSPAGAAMAMEIPLLPGESVTTQGIRVKNRIARVSLGADQTELVWEAFLEKSGRIRLAHPDTDAWTEVWRVDVSPVFHMDYQGIPVILHKTGTRWFPTWHPWPGEAVELTLTRPQGVAGQTLTVEKSRLKLWPGRNTTRATLALSVKSSQGGQHTLTLPEEAGLQEVSVNGKVYPIRQNGRKVTLPVAPGVQQIRLSWMESRGLATRFESSRVNLGIPSVNAGTDIYLPGSRWPLFIGGEQLVGPAVLFWSVLIMTGLLALGLSRTGWAGLKFHHWFLIWIGMSMSHPGAGLLVAGWLIALDFRKKAGQLQGNHFNLVQCGLAFLTLAAMAALVFAISNGLLGHPDMNIRGNGSHSGLLRWYHDISGPVLPKAWVISIPMPAYRITMLAWALWVAFWLSDTLKWGWRRFSTPVIWKKRPPKKKKTETSPD